MSEIRPRILFVDDEALMLSSLRRVFRTRREEWEMAFESEPLKAVELCRNEHFDVIVSDLRMPDLNGIEMIGEMKSHRDAETEYILLTGNADLASAIDAINKTGVFRFLTKPCASENLLEAIELALTAIESRREHPGNMATAALSAMSPAVAVVDGRSRVIYLNESADEVMKSHKGILVDRNGVLAVNVSGARGHFQEAVRKAADEPDTGPKFVSLSDPEDCEALTAVVMPVGQKRAAVLFTVPGRTAPPSVESLVDLFGLTRVEAVIARTIASGGTVESAACDCKVTLETARTYLKRIFQKTGVRRQVDLVQLILTTPVPLVRSRM
ncbi:DNA-binding response regulator [Roseibium aggregatum]|uniref:Response regulator n=1 Tax=Roseibium aggregatum TaxID=187304 RepID=A0A939EG42_9HYPH|nr:response regulator [Roseibium aggregatum]MBN9672096.1 response regulator [Roseibium aggregatum]